MSCGRAVNGTALNNCRVEIKSLTPMEPALSYYDRMFQQHQAHIAAILDKTIHPSQVELEQLSEKTRAVQRLEAQRLDEDAEAMEDATLYYPRQFRECLFLPLLIILGLVFFLSCVMFVVSALIWISHSLNFHSDLGAKLPTLVLGASTLLFGCLLGSTCWITSKTREDTQDNVLF
jgi:hypothetical protein